MTAGDSKDMATFDGQTLAWTPNDKYRQFQYRSSANNGELHLSPKALKWWPAINKQRLLQGPCFESGIHFGDATITQRAATYMHPWQHCRLLQSLPALSAAFAGDARLQFECGALFRGTISCVLDHDFGSGIGSLGVSRIIASFFARFWVYVSLGDRAQVVGRLSLVQVWGLWACVVGPSTRCLAVSNVASELLNCAGT